LLDIARPGCSLEVLTLSRRGIVPDYDRIGLRLTRGWWKVLRCLERHDSAERTEDLVMGALAASLRKSGGVPGLAGLAEQMQRSAAGDPSAELPSAGLGGGATTSRLDWPRKRPQSLLRP